MPDGFMGVTRVMRVMRVMCVMCVCCLLCTLSTMLSRLEQHLSRLPRLASRESTNKTLAPQLVLLGLLPSVSHTTTNAPTASSCIDGHGLPVTNSP